MSNDKSMRDIDIRPVLLRSLYEQHDDSDTLVVEELGLCQGEARIDVAVINGYIHGYEIKSELDTLDRLPHQQDIYNRTLDSVTLIASSNHLKAVSEKIPVWWGVSEAIYKKGILEIREVRPPKSNDSLDSTAIVQLLWRNEALEILKKRNLHLGIASKPRLVLWTRILECLPVEELKLEVRNCIKSRKFWRSG